MNEIDSQNSQQSDELLVTAEGEVQEFKPIQVTICTTHTKDTWLTHFEYLDNHDGTVSCKFCPWGTPLPGYMRCHEGKIIDLRELSRS